MRIFVKELVLSYSVEFRYVGDWQDGIFLFFKDLGKIPYIKSQELLKEHTLFVERVAVQEISRNCLRSCFQFPVQVVKHAI